MADKEKTKNNVLMLQEIRLKGKAVPKGAILAKSAFPNKSDWQNLLHMDKPRVEETDEAVRDSAPKAKADKSPAAPGA